MYFVTLCPLELYLGSESLPGAGSAVTMSVAVDSLFGSWAEVSGEGAGFRLKRPIVGGRSCEAGRESAEGEMDSRQANDHRLSKSAGSSNEVTAEGQKEASC